MMNPYAPPQAAVRDVVDPWATIVLADRASRLGADILDRIIFAGTVFVPMIIVMTASMARVAADNPEQGIDDAVVGGAVVLAFVGFVIWCWITIRLMKRNGQSIGKKMVNIKVVRVDGSPVALGRLFWLRNVVNGLLSIVPLYGIVDALFIFSESRQCLHDKIADTLVIKA